MRSLFGDGGIAILIIAAAFYTGWSTVGRAFYMRRRLRSELRTYGLGRRLR